MTPRTVKDYCQMASVARREGRPDDAKSSVEQAVILARASGNDARPSHQNTSFLRWFRRVLVRVLAITPLPRKLRPQVSLALFILTKSFWLL